MTPLIDNTRGRGRTKARLLPEIGFQAHPGVPASLAGATPLALELKEFASYGTPVIVS